MYKYISHIMENFLRFIILNPVKVIVFFILVTMIPISHIPQVKLDTSIIGLLKKEDPNLIVYNQLRTQFGRDEKIIIGIQSDTIFSLDFFAMLKDIHTEIEDTVPFIEKVTSLYNVRNTRSEGDQLKTDDVMTPFPTTQKEINAIRDKVVKSVFYKELFISSDTKMCTIIIE
ncbi:MAG TPA: hypothetical protein EYG89_06425, partial [Bacteroidia bacterium]|nr:hypothetical protein [Bacteroidia bacterium]